MLTSSEWAPRGTLAFGTPTSGLSRRLLIIATKASAQDCNLMQERRPPQELGRAGEPSAHADVSHVRSVPALRRASFSRVNSSSVFVSTSVYGRPCRRVWCRTGSPAESIWV